MWRPGTTSQIFLGILSGVILGLSLKFGTEQPWTDRQLMYFQFPGELFLRTVNCLILPLVMTSIVSASSSLGKSGRYESLRYPPYNSIYTLIFGDTLYVNRLKDEKKKNCRSNWRLYYFCVCDYIDRIATTLSSASVFLRIVHFYPEDKALWRLNCVDIISIADLNKTSRRRAI